MRALIILDVQNDFLPDGALAVAHGDEVIPVANRVQSAFALVAATQDWHPAGHGSFASSHPGKHPGDLVALRGREQVLWPDHCVQGSRGADFAARIDLRRAEAIFRKGTDPGIDSYSGFFDNAHERSTGLGDWLKGRGVSEVVLLGLATDYCVLYSALDARRLGFETTLVADGCRGVELQPGDVVRAVDAMRAAGVHISSSREILAG